MISPVTIDIFAALFNCTLVDRASEPELKLFIFVGWDRRSSSVAWSTGDQLTIFFCFKFSVLLFDRPGIFICNALRGIWNPGIPFFIVLRRDLCVYFNGSFTS